MTAKNRTSRWITRCLRHAGFVVGAQLSALRPKARSKAQSQRVAWRDRRSLHRHRVDNRSLAQTVALTRVCAAVWALSCACGAAWPAPSGDSRKNTFSPPEECGKCHPQHYREWRSSAHAYATVDPIFQACLRNGQKVTGGRVGKLCLGCHAPLGVETGELRAGLDGLKGASAVAKAGVSCEVCHRLEVDHGREHVGNASFRLRDAREKVVLGRLVDPVSTPAHKSVKSEGLGESEFCGSCHDVIQHGRPLEKSFAEWSESIYRTQRRTRCQDCHMVRYSGQAAVGGPYREGLRRHNFPAATVPLIPFPNRGYQEEQVRAILRTAARLTVAVPRQVAAGSALEIRVDVKNSGAGHNLPSGLSTFRQMWLEVTVKDDRDALVFASGHLDALGDLMDEHSEVAPHGDPHLVTYTDKFVDRDGNEVSFFFEADRVIERSLKPLEERTSRYHAAVAPDLLGRRLRLRVRLLFRPYPPHGLRFLGLDELVERLPIWVMDSYVSEGIEVVRTVNRSRRHEVPKDFAQIQAAIDAAIDGDEIVVAPGRYVLPSPIDFRGKGVRVASLRGPHRTILELHPEAARTDRASVALFQSGEGPEAQLVGFTLRGGRGTAIHGERDRVSGRRHGGGVFIDRSAPVIERNRILLCGVTDGFGGGIASFDGSPKILNNVIESCWAERGGGVAIVSGAGEGAARFVGNRCDGNFAVFGGGLLVAGGRSVRVIQVLLAGNRAREAGGGVHVDGGVSLRLSGATLVRNEAELAGDISVAAGASAAVDSSIVWENEPRGSTATFRFSVTDVGQAQADASNRVEVPLFRDPSGAWESRGRVPLELPAAAGPLASMVWVGGDYRLADGSPAIDAGDPTTRTDPDDSRADAGAFFMEKPLNAFIRGDVDGDGLVGWNDALAVFAMVADRQSPRCADAADVDDDGDVDDMDLLHAVMYLRGGWVPPSAPFPECGLDPTFGEGLGCSEKGTTCLDAPR